MAEFYCGDVLLTKLQVVAILIRIHGHILVEEKKKMYSENEKCYNIITAGTYRQPIMDFDTFDLDTIHLTCPEAEVPLPPATIQGRFWR